MYENPGEAPAPLPLCCQRPCVQLGLLRSVYTERDRDRGFGAFTKEWSK